jgi:hypothetical protein
MDEVAAHLQEAARFKQTKPDTLKFDLEDKEGDLIAFASNRYYAQSVKEIRDTCKETWESEVKASEKRRLARVAAALKVAWAIFRKHDKTN